MEDIDNKDKYSRCWICGSLVLKTREENHHIFTESLSPKETRICILCHDIVDRMLIDDIDLFQEFVVNSIEELKRFPNDFKWTKLYILKMAKIMSPIIKKLEEEKNA